MAWTEERVETLKKLWADGLSASQIAKHLGGVTRNAVIGKVHRLGLSGRAAPSRPARHPAAKPAPRPRAQPAVPASTVKAKPAAAPQPALRPGPAPVEAKRLASGEYATVLTLKDTMCKWPIGDPADTTFRFCGRRSGPGHAYCEAHAQLAYQPQAKRKRKPADDARAVLDGLQGARKVNF